MSLIFNELNTRHEINISDASEEEIDILNSSQKMDKLSSNLELNSIPWNPLQFNLDHNDSLFSKNISRPTPNWSYIQLYISSITDKESINKKTHKNKSHYVGKNINHQIGKNISHQIGKNINHQVGKNICLFVNDGKKYVSYYDFSIQARVTKIFDDSPK